MHGTLGWQGRRLQRCHYRPDEGPWYSREGVSSKVIFAFQNIKSSLQEAPWIIRRACAPARAAPPSLGLLVSTWPNARQPSRRPHRKLCGFFVLAFAFATLKLKREVG